MPSLVDIPAHLLPIHNKDSFLSWLKQLPVESWVKRSLLRAWGNHNLYTPVASDYHKVGL